MDVVDEWITRIGQLAADKELKKDKKKRSSAYNALYIEGHAFLESEFQAGRFHPGLGICIYMLAEPEHYKEALIALAERRSAEIPKTPPARAAAAEGTSTPSVKHPERLVGKGSLHAEIPAPKGFFIAGPCLPDEYRLLWLVYRVLEGRLPLGESQQKSMRKLVKELGNSYGSVLVRTPRLKNLPRVIDRSDIDELERLWPEVEKELVGAVSERHKAQDDPIGARLARVVDSASKSIRQHQTPPMEGEAAGSTGTTATTSTRAKKRKRGTPPIYSDAERKADRRRWRRWLPFRQSGGRKNRLTYRDFHSHCLRQEDDETPADYQDFRKSLMRGKEATRALRAERGKKSL